MTIQDASVRSELDAMRSTAFVLTIRLSVDPKRVIDIVTKSKTFNEAFMQIWGFGFSSKKAAAYQRAAKQSEVAVNHGVRIIGYFDESYPEALRSIPNPPPVLWVKGDIGCRQRVAVVGTRDPSPFGRRVAESASEFLVEHGASVVSGLALGCDAVAHQVAVEPPGHTIAVLAHDLSSIYPAANAGLARTILERGGALVSETAFGEPSKPERFLARNRIQSGLSSAVLVCQTDSVGGSMATARYAFAQGRKVFVPFPPGVHAEHPKSRGLFDLAEQGAVWIKGREEYASLLT